MAEIIAEIGQNHNGDMDLARTLIRRARDAGADVAKFQLYEACALFPRENNPWYEYNCRTELNRDQTQLLAEECARVGIEFMASVFDLERLGWLEALGVRRHKIASRSVNDRPLVAAAAATGKPLIVSLGQWGGSRFPDVPAPGGVSFLYCVSRYPTPLPDLHLGRVDFERYAGFSDHTVGITAALVALSRGARIIEKHFTLDKDLFGPDHRGSATPEELRRIHEFRDELAECL